MVSRAGWGLPGARRGVGLLIGALLLACLPLAPLPAAEPPPALAFGSAVLRLGADGLGAALAPLPFSLAGVETPPGSPDHPVSLRVSPDGRTWSAWMPVEADGEVASDPVWTGAARWLQVRGPRHTAIRVQLVDSLGLSAGPLDRLLARARAALATAVRGPRAAAAPPRPGIVSRAAWGADERLRRGAPRYADGVRALVLHHTAGGNGYRPEEGPAVVRGIYGYHTRVLGWDDIGYHLLVDRYGRVYEGRAGGVDRPVIGAHTGGFNQRTSGVAVLGSFGDAAPPAPALRALVDVLAWKAGVHGVDPRGTVELRSTGSTRYPAGAHVRVPALNGHRDLSRTACPGQALYARLPDLREAVATRMRESSSALPGAWDDVWEDVWGLLPLRS